MPTYSNKASSSISAIEKYGYVVMCKSHAGIPLVKGKNEQKCTIQWSER